MSINERTHMVCPYCNGAPAAEFGACGLCLTELTDQVGRESPRVQQRHIASRETVVVIDTDSAAELSQRRTPPQRRY